MMIKLEDQIENRIQEFNHRGISAFQGYSPFEMDLIINDPFGENCPVQLNKLSEDDYLQIPLLMLFKYLANLVETEGAMKLTARGYLAPRVIKDMYAQHFIEDYSIEAGITKLTTEKDSNTIHLTRLLLELAGIIKKRNNKLSLTRAGEKTLRKDDDTLLRLLLSTFCTKFNWAYFDGFGENRIGQMGFGFSFVLLDNFGREKNKDSYYAEKYFDAYPALINHDRVSEYRTAEETSYLCYSIRTFERFLEYFGLVTVTHERRFDADTFIQITPLFTKLVKIIPPMGPI